MSDFSPSATHASTATSSSIIRPPFILTGKTAASAAAARSGASSPSHEMTTTRPFSKRAREIQAQEGVQGMPMHSWGGPPTSGNSTPLRENIPESPVVGGAHQYAQNQLPTPDSLPQNRRPRAGTVPSRFSPGGPGGIIGASAHMVVPIPSSLAKSSRLPPSVGHYKFSPSSAYDSHVELSGSSALLSRLRAGSLPQRSPFATPLPTPVNSPFGPSIFSSWNPAAIGTLSTLSSLGFGRDRASTLASIASIGLQSPNSPAQSAFSRDSLAGESDVHMRTLDYLGLAEPHQSAHLGPVAGSSEPVSPLLSDFGFSAQACRFRSYSVNNKDRYADEEDDYDTDGTALESQYVAQLQDHLAATNAAIHHHNLAVQAFASSHASIVHRPRAHTAGVLDNPASNIMRNYFADAATTTMPNPIGMALPAVSLATSSLDPRQQHDRANKDLDELPQGLRGISLNLARSSSRSNAAVGTSTGLLSPEDQGPEGPTSALWLGSIPTSTTISTLTEMFKVYGQVISARVLTHKNCAFVNFDRVESAASAKSCLNGKEIFPGAGPIRINFAKPPSAATTPGHDGIFPSPSPDPFSGRPDSHVRPELSARPQRPGKESGQAQDANFAAAQPLTSSSATTSQVPSSNASLAAETGDQGSNVNSNDTAFDMPDNGSLQQGNLTVPPLKPLADLAGDMLEIVGKFGASEEDRAVISRSVQAAVQFDTFIDEIPSVPEPTSTRVHDAPKLREIRKRIDNQTFSKAEIEDVAMEMLPEIADLSSDYLGNTVVQKLFEHCSDHHRDLMLAAIAPHMAEIGVHKNGTWAAQKIIDVCKTPYQMFLIVKHLHPYTVPLFLDQYGNYVLQGCLKYGAPYNNFIFETMLSRMWEIAQGRYGARAMRACLESHLATKDQQRMLAAAIALHSVQLATNANGALLLTWLLDTCNFAQRRTVLAPQLVPQLLQLCTHKVAYLTVLKVINQKSEPDARDAVLRALFFTPGDRLLEAILLDHACGATLIFKVITTPFFDEIIRTQVVENVKAVLVRIKALPNQGYKRLMDEVGLSIRGGNAGAPGEPRQRSSSRHASGGANGHHKAGPRLHHSPMSHFETTTTYAPSSRGDPRSEAPSASLYTPSGLLYHHQHSMVNQTTTPASAFAHGCLPGPSTFEQQYHPGSGHIGGSPVLAAPIAVVPGHGAPFAVDMGFGSYLHRQSLSISQHQLEHQRGRVGGHGGYFGHRNRAN